MNKKIDEMAAIIENGSGEFATAVKSLLIHNPNKYTLQPLKRRVWAII